MKKSSLFFLLVSLQVFVFAQRQPTTRPVQVTKPAEQATAPSGKVFGVVFSDYFYVAQEPVPFIAGKTLAGRNEFSIRRAHIGYEHIFNRDFSARVLYDANVNDLQEGNVEWRNIFPMHALTIGMMQTTSEQTAEKVWGYRSLGELVLNRIGFAHEFDMGISVMGKFNPQGTGYYTLGAANGTGTLAENDKVKKFSGTLGFVPDKMSVVEIYADYENLSLGRSNITGKIFYGMATQTYAFGVEAFYRMNRKASPTFKDVTPIGGSLLSWFEMSKGIRGVLRIDGVDDDLSQSSTGFRDIYVNIGLDYAPIPEVHIIPNIVYTKQLAKGSVPEESDTIIGRLTAAVYFPTFK